ncbi:MAG TPA: NADH-quinone oxidoreductase subunit J [Pirellulales bacterium]
MDAINWHSLFFLLFAVVACGSAVAVVVATNIVRMALCLIVSLGATSGLFFLAGADFVGSMQLMIYVGGTLVLLIFGVMLTAQGPFISMRTGGGDWIVAVMLSGCLAALLVPAAFSVVAWRNQPTVAVDAHADQHAADERGATAKIHQVSEVGTHESANDAAAVSFEGDQIGEGRPRTSTHIGLGLLGARVDRLQPGSADLKPGMAGYLLPFELVSVHLLVVLVGAAYLARTKRRAKPQREA